LEKSASSDIMKGTEL